MREHSCKETRQCVRDDLAHQAEVHSLKTSGTVSDCRFHNAATESDSCQDSDATTRMRRTCPAGFTTSGKRSGAKDRDVVLKECNCTECGASAQTDHLLKAQTTIVRLARSGASFSCFYYGSAFCCVPHCPRCSQKVTLPWVQDVVVAATAPLRHFAVTVPPSAISSLELSQEAPIVAELETTVAAVECQCTSSAGPVQRTPEFLAFLAHFCKFSIVCVD